MRQDEVLLIRLRDAPRYLGMSINIFNRLVRPHIKREIRIGDRGIAFKRLDLDEWVEQTMSRNGRPTKEGTKWDAKELRVSINVTGSGISTKQSTEDDFAKALSRVNSKKRSAI